METGGGSASTASHPTSGHATGPRDLYIHPGSGQHGSIQQSGERTFNLAVNILMRKPHAESLQRASAEVGEVANRRVAVDLGHGAAVRKHSNTVKQKGRVRTALCGSG